MIMGRPSGLLEGGGQHQPQKQSESPDLAGYRQPLLLANAEAKAQKSDGTMSGQRMLIHHQILVDGLL